MHNYHMILSRNHTAHFGFKDNANILVLGQVGTYKTRGHILPNIMEQDTISMVISDTKGELKAKTEKLLSQKGYIVKHINFDDPANILCVTTHGPIADSCKFVHFSMLTIANICSIILIRCGIV